MRALLLPLLTIMMIVATVCEAEAQSVPPAMRAQAQALMSACRSDFDRLCSSVSPGGGRILACLQRNAAALSPTCKAAMPAAAALRDQARASGAMPR
jgi:hypothetical protein